MFELLTLSIDLVLNTGGSNGFKDYLSLPMGLDGFKVKFSALLIICVLLFITS